MTPSLEGEYRDALTRSLQAGSEALGAGGTAIDAVCAAVRVMEDSPLFNAGRGSNFDERGVVTMDASIMDGSTLDAGAVADVTDVRYPVDLARLVMERSEHLMLTGPGAEAFARASGVEATEASFFHTERRWTDLQRAKENRGARPNVIGSTDPTERAGTVGAVARDRAGRLAAATSTGGMANKTWGRVGDSPIIGAGTYASRLCAVSCTGWGEFFIRHAVAHDVHARMAHGGVGLTPAVHGVIWDTLEAQVPGAGGLVAIDGDGNVELCFNTPGMYRGWIDGDGAHHVAIYRED
jgi:beta-aspartyl-peptidase (threonine type)